jgi:hypothetical protein
MLIGVLSAVVTCYHPGIGCAPSANETLSIGATNLKAVGVSAIQLPSNQYETEKRASVRDER